MTGFVVDTMLGTLAKWLRAMGHEAAYVPHAPDGWLLEIASAEGRMILTRDAELARRAGEAGLLVPAGGLDDQLRFVAGKCVKPATPPLSRCLECNVVLREVGPAEAVSAGMPPEIAEREERFWLCTGCERPFWRGTHYDAMIRKIQALFPDSESGLL